MNLYLIKRYIDDFYYNVKWYFKNQFFFFHELYSHRNWDYMHSLRMFQRSLELQIGAMERYSQEIEVDKECKLKLFKRAVYIISILEDVDIINQLVFERTGIKYEDERRPITYNECEEGDDFMEVNMDVTDNMRTFLKVSDEIENELWNELWDIIKGKESENYGFGLRDLWY